MKSRVNRVHARRRQQTMVSLLSRGDVKTAALMGNGEAQGMMADYCYNHRHVLDAEQSFRVHALRREVAATTIYAFMARTRCSTAETGKRRIEALLRQFSLARLRESQTWSRRAATNGDLQGAFRYAHGLTRGFCANPDFVTAAKWYTVAAKKRCTSSMVNLAMLYLKGGHGLKKNVNESERWTKNAIEIVITRECESTVHTVAQRKKLSYISRLLMKFKAKIGDIDGARVWRERAAILA